MGFYIIVVGFLLVSTGWYGVLYVEIKSWSWASRKCILLIVLICQYNFDKSDNYLTSLIFFLQLIRVWSKELTEISTSINIAFIIVFYCIILRAIQSIKMFRNIKTSVRKIKLSKVNQASTLLGYRYDNDHSRVFLSNQQSLKHYSIMSSRSTILMTKNTLSFDSRLDIWLINLTLFSNIT